MLKFIVFTLLFLVVAAYLYLNRYALSAWLSDLMGRVRGEEHQDQSLEEDEQSPASRRSFAEYTNPVGHHEPSEVVVITFQALEAWADEQGMQRNDDETPSEFAGRIAMQFPQLHGPTFRVVDAYNRVVFGRVAANDRDVQAAGAVWNMIQSRVSTAQPEHPLGT